MSGQLTSVMAEMLEDAKAPFSIRGEVIDGGYWFTMEACGHQVQGGDFAAVELEMFKRIVTSPTAGAKHE